MVRFKFQKPVFEGSCEKPEVEMKDKETSCEVSDFNVNEKDSTMEMEIQTSIEDPRQVDKLEKHCQELELKLSDVQIKILEIINDKKSSDEENSNLKEKIKLLTNSFRGRSPVNFNDGVLWDSSHEVPPTKNNLCDTEAVVNQESDNATVTVPSVENEKHLLSQSPSDNYKISDQTDFSNVKPVDVKDNQFNLSSLSQFAFEITNNLNDTDLNHKDFSILESKSLSPLCLKSGRNNYTNGASNENINTETDIKGVPCENNFTDMESTLSGLMSENNELKEKCRDLENCLEMMRVEYEKCEDYWQSKIDEERRIFDQVS